MLSFFLLQKCESYDYDAVKSAVKRGLDLIGGPHRFAAPNEKIRQTRRKDAAQRTLPYLKPWRKYSWRQE